MLRWYWFTATKDGESLHERIPSESWGKAREALSAMGYKDITLTQTYQF